MSEAHRKDFPATRRHRDDRAIASAASFGLADPGPAKKGGMTVATVLATLGVDEPSDWIAADVSRAKRDVGHTVQRHPRAGKVLSERCAINFQDRGPVDAWAQPRGGP